MFGLCGVCIMKLRMAVYSLAMRFFTFDLNWGITKFFLCVKGAGMTDLLTGLLLSSHCMYQTRYVSSSQL